MSGLSRACERVSEVQWRRTAGWTGPVAAVVDLRNSGSLNVYAVCSGENASVAVSTEAVLGREGVPNVAGERDFPSLRTRVTRRHKGVFEVRDESLTQVRGDRSYAGRMHERVAQIDDGGTVSRL